MLRALTNDHRIEQNFLTIILSVIGELMTPAFSKEGLEAILNHHLASLYLLFSSCSSSLIIPSLARRQVNTASARV